MRMKKSAMWVVVATIAATLPMASGRAQDTATASTQEASTAEHFYRFDFVVEEIDDAGKVNNSRSYVETIATGPGSSQAIRTGSRIPIATGAENGSTQFQYVDVGVSFDVRQVREVGDKLSLTLKAELSSLAQEHVVTGTGVGDPVIRQNRWDSTVLIPVGKPTVVYSADDLDSKGKMQVEVTATRVE